LDLSRAQILEMAAAWGLAWREDPSNQDPRYARNRVRRDVLPALKDLNAAAVANFAALADLQREETAARQERATRLAKFMVHGIAPGVVEVDRRALLALPQAEARWVLRAVMTDQGTSLEAAALARALATAGDGAARDLGAGWRAAAQGAWLVLEGLAARPAPRPYGGPGRQETEDWGWDVTAGIGTSERAASPACVRFDLAALPGPLAWRSAEPDDDTFQPWGAAAPMGLRAFLTRQGIPRHRQASLLVLAAGATIAWLVGVRRGAVAPATKQAAEVVEMQARASFQV
jgi:tRNA(Ile)-lysidine synthase